ncbi:hypothetical protein OUZ56_005081 [Daphnia magna]|uniref:Uncharacterized protein n=1 Tax=Daphnia magna TaxID=35525 RepID=A0ABQ9YS31_9CRUS|nr:hypothetical protein OUZ56_005081 [Daphnia magna]
MAEGTQMMHTKKIKKNLNWFESRNQERSTQPPHLAPSKRLKTATRKPPAFGCFSRGGGWLGGGRGLPLDLDRQRNEPPPPLQKKKSPKLSTH